MFVLELELELKNHKPNNNCTIYILKLLLELRPLDVTVLFPHSLTSFVRHTVLWSCIRSPFGRSLYSIEEYVLVLVWRTRMLTENDIFSPEK